MMESKLIISVIVIYIQNCPFVLHVRLNADDSNAGVLHPAFTHLSFCLIYKHLFEVLK